MAQDTTNTEMHFKPTFGYVCMLSGFILLYVVAITFLPIPEKNQRFVDIVLAFLLGMLSQASTYLTGGNPTATKKNEPTITQTADSITNAPTAGAQASSADTPANPD